MSHRAAGVNAIIAYKWIKAVAELALCVIALVLLARGAEAAAATFAQVLLDHFTGPGGLRVATLIVRSATSKHVRFIAFLAFADALLSAVEGWALQREYAWAPWLVVGATASLLPWELLHAIARPVWTRIVLLIANVVVVVYLLFEANRRSPGAPDTRVELPPGGVR